MPATAAAMHSDGLINVSHTRQPCAVERDGDRYARLKDVTDWRTLAMKARTHADVDQLD